MRAAVTTFCSTPRPTRRETIQLDDLARPLLEQVSDDTLRFTAAALSDSPYAPPSLIRSLCEQPVDICAPVLIRSPILTNIDLLALIGRQGVAHARAIAARPNLDARIIRLIASLNVFESDFMSPNVEQTQDQLRSMMQPAGTMAETDIDDSIGLNWNGKPNAYEKLRSTALTGIPALFHTALADLLEISVKLMSAIVDGQDVSKFIVALRALDISEEQAFLIFQCVWPTRSGKTHVVRSFLEAWGTVSSDQARMIVNHWRGDTGPKGPGEPANQETSFHALQAI